MSIKKIIEDIVECKVTRNKSLNEEMSDFVSYGCVVYYSRLDENTVSGVTAGTRMKQIAKRGRQGSLPMDRESKVFQKKPPMQPQPLPQLQPQRTTVV